MKALVVLPVVVLVAACAAPAPRKPLTASSPQTAAARVTYWNCVEAAQKGMKGTSQDSARDIARTATGVCESQLLAVRTAVEAENAGDPYAGAFTDTYIQKLRERTVGEVAAGIMRAP